MSQYLLNKRQQQIKNKIEQEQYVQAMSIIEETIDNNIDSNELGIMLTKNAFKCICADPSCSRHKVLRYIFQKTNECFFDPDLCCYTIGICLSKDTGVDLDVLDVLGERMKNMHPKLLSSVLCQIPQNQITNNKIYNKLS